MPYIPRIAELRQQREAQERAIAAQRENMLLQGLVVTPALQATGALIPYLREKYLPTDMEAARNALAGMEVTRQHEAMESAREAKRRYENEPLIGSGGQALVTDETGRVGPYIPPFAEVARLRQVAPAAPAPNPTQPEASSARGINPQPSLAAPLPMVSKRFPSLGSAPEVLPGYSPPSREEAGFEGPQPIKGRVLRYVTQRDMDARKAADEAFAYLAAPGEKRYQQALEAYNKGYEYADKAAQRKATTYDTALRGEYQLASAWAKASGERETANIRWVELIANGTKEGVAGAVAKARTQEQAATGLGGVVGWMKQSLGLRSEVPEIVKQEAVDKFADVGRKAFLAKFPGAEKEADALFSKDRLYQSLGVTAAKEQAQAATVAKTTAETVKAGIETEKLRNVDEKATKAGIASDVWTQLKAAVYPQMSDFSMGATTQEALDRGATLVIELRQQGVLDTPVKYALAKSFIESAASATKPAQSAMGLRVPAMPAWNTAAASAVQDTGALVQAVRAAFAAAQARGVNPLEDAAYVNAARRAKAAGVQVGGDR